MGGIPGGPAELLWEVGQSACIPGGSPENRIIELLVG